MEPERPDTTRPEPLPRTELRALAQLRDRVEAAAREVERLREENAALAGRVAEFQAGGGAGAPPALPGSGDPEKLKAQIQGFIDALDRVLSPPEAVEDAQRRNG